MLTIIYEDQELIVVEKPIGLESQAVHSFEPDMVSEVKKHINNLYTYGKEPYVGVIHRLDKPVGGIMVYAKTPKSAAFLSKQVQSRDIKKYYKAVICGKPVDTVGNYVDYLLRVGKSNSSQIVDKGITGAKKAELNYRLLGTIETEGAILSLVDIELLTGRHHQIRIQFAGHGTPLWGDSRYNPEFCTNSFYKRVNIALCACQLTFRHPITSKIMDFKMEPTGKIFEQFVI